MGQTAQFKPENLSSGTFGYVYIDGVEVIELSGFSAKDEIQYESVSQPGQLRDGQKMMKVEGSGEITMNYLRSDFIKSYADKIDQGIQPTVEILGILDDPNALESTQVLFSGCTIERLEYLIFSGGELVGQTFPFHFTSRKYL